MKYSDIPKFTRSGSYQVHMPWIYLQSWVNDMKEEMGLKMEPKFQRGHVWTEAQQIAYVEFVMRGGNTSQIAYFNCPRWRHSVKKGAYDECVCVDGLQRITAVLRFMNNEIPAFGTYYKDFEGRMGIDYAMQINVNDLQTEKEVLQWYVDLNEGGTPHTDQEIQKVKDMIVEIDQRKE